MTKKDAIRKSLSNMNINVSDEDIDCFCSDMVEFGYNIVTIEKYSLGNGEFHYTKLYDFMAFGESFSKIDNIAKHLVQSEIHEKYPTISSDEMLDFQDEMLKKISVNDIATLSNDFILAISGIRSHSLIKIRATIERFNASLS